MFKSPLELAIIALVMFLLFGAKKLPEAARSIGQSFKIFKEEINSVQENVKLDPATSQIPEVNLAPSKE
jgi:sec-independent protein translocase protein TatA